MRLTDIWRMINYELSLLQDNPEWLELLRAYSTTVPDEQGWSARLHEAEGIEPEHLPRIHGKLIAFGFLDFQLADRHEGVFYQLTSLGRQGLIRLRADSTGEQAESLEEFDDEVDETTLALEEADDTGEPAEESEAA